MKLITNDTDVKPGITLSPSEMRLILSWRELNTEQKAIYAGAIHDCADEERLLRRRPAFRVIAGGRH